MATLKVFVSSTCYDLGIVRSKLQEFLRSFGFEPVLSEYADVLYDHRVHTHTSCLDEVLNCDAVILLIGSRFGGKAVPEAHSRIDINNLKLSSAATAVLEPNCPLSVTQLEVLRAVQHQLPLFAFVDERVLFDHLVYEKNKNKTILSEITFPSIERQETAQYIFEFINYLRLRTTGNAVIPFGKIDDIEHHLRKQWSALFQRLLREDRTRTADANRSRDIQVQLEDLKAAILSSIQEPEARQVARSVIRFRRFIEFAVALNAPRNHILSDQFTWGALMSFGGVSHIAKVEPTLGPSRAFLVFNDQSVAALRTHFRSLTTLKDDLSSFVVLPDRTRAAVLDAWTESSATGRDSLLWRNGTTFEELKANPRYQEITIFDASDPLVEVERIELPRKSSDWASEEEDDGPSALFAAPTSR